VRQKPYHEEISRPDWTKSSRRPACVLWLDKNENTDIVLSQFTTSWLKQISTESVLTYPDCSALYHKLAHNLALSADNLILAAGSDGVIRLAYEAFVLPGDKVLFPSPTFAMYEVYAQIYGAQAIKLDYQASDNGPFLDMDKFIELIIFEKPTLICLPNPDSPTGAVVEPGFLKRMIEAAKKVSAVVLIDEAYYPFYDQTVLPWVRQEDNLLVSRTFSKAWGLAGARVGFAAGCNKLIKALHKLRPMYEIGAISVALIDKALDYENEINASVERLLAGKQYFAKNLKKMNFKVLEKTQGNFIHVAFGEHAEVIHQGLERTVLYRKDFLHPSLSGYSRFSATTIDLYKQVLDRIAQSVDISHKEENVI